VADALNGTTVLVRLKGGIGNSLQALPLIRGLQMVGARVSIELANPEVPEAMHILWGLIAGSERLDFDHEAEIVLDLPYFGAFINPFTKQKVVWDEVYTKRWAWLSGEACLYLRSVFPDGTLPPALPVSLREANPQEPKPLRVALFAEGKPKHKIKRYPFLTELATELARYGWKPIILGLEKDSPIPSADDLRGEPFLLQLSRLRECILFIGSDGGWAHIAAALGIPSLVIFGPTSPQKNKPPYPWAWVIAREGGCRFCQNWNERHRLPETCPHGVPPPCLRISPQSIAHLTTSKAFHLSSSESCLPSILV